MDSCNHTLAGTHAQAHTHTVTYSFWQKTVNAADCWINLPRHCSPLHPSLLGRKWSLSSSSVFSHFPGRTPSAPLVPICAPLPYISTSNLICIVIALVNSTIWLWSSSDSLCLGCIKSFDADTDCLRARASVFVCVSGSGRAAHVTRGFVLMLPFCFHLISLSWLVQVWLFISGWRQKSQSLKFQLKMKLLRKIGGFWV